MSRKRKSDEDLFDLEDSESSSENMNHLERVMTLLEDSGIEFTIKKVANGKTLTLDNSIVFRFNHEEELSAIDK